MQIEIQIDSSCKEPKVIIITDQMTEEISRLARYLSGTSPQLLTGFQEDRAEILEQAELLRIYASSGKVIAQTAKGDYTLRLRLYELEERLDDQSFVRISHSEIVNLKKVKGFDLSLSGTICVTLTDGTATYVSRRYVSKIKQVLGI